MPSVGGLCSRRAGPSLQSKPREAAASSSPRRGTVEVAWIGTLYPTMRALCLGFLTFLRASLGGTCCVQGTFTVSPQAVCREGSSWANRYEEVNLSWKLCQVIWFGRGWSLPWKRHYLSQALKGICPLSGWSTLHFSQSSWQSERERRRAWDQL